MSDTGEIRRFWDQQAQQHGTDFAATVPDKYAKQLEIEAISRFLDDGQAIADIGCGNGYSCFKYFDRHELSITGVDYSEAMIQQAQRAREALPPRLRDNIRFQQGDVMATGLPAEQFDRVITDRCLINLTSRQEQATAIDEMARIVKPGGLYLMCENTEQGLANLNGARRQVGLDEIAVRWHNLYLDETRMQAAAAAHFELVEEVRFGGFYYLASRIINALIAEESGEQPSYLSPINEMAARLSGRIDCGDFGPVKLFVFKKRQAPVS
ncbi:class I SAM-dependent methyltransferase [Exilibacterium tricleocarpae]|uniref:Class I SAM-dependent methyltransferase n=1 Tax=Exilibacterium tricleocarpae TaxID=2591008 RepID=A0A545U3V4_9GAMM|nr:class I SAM-dependent methyltransferase [Exilibacterium tricleocarpae]TQV84149.1 class I SAM-dependent methyltransferase [Exilibacterium tricleocarpae]